MEKSVVVLIFMDSIKAFEMERMEINMKIRRWEEIDHLKG